VGESPVEHAEPTMVVVKNDYLFDVNVTLNVPASPKKTAEPSGKKTGN
jgi:hypothetical protein